MLDALIFCEEYFIFTSNSSPHLPPTYKNHSAVLLPVCVCWVEWGDGSCRYCGICISFPRRPVGRPRAVYLSGYKAASQKLPGRRCWNRGGRRGDRMSLWPPPAPPDVQVFQTLLEGSRPGKSNAVGETIAYLKTGTQSPDFSP